MSLASAKRMAAKSDQTARRTNNRDIPLGPSACGEGIHVRNASACQGQKLANKCGEGEPMKTCPRCRAEAKKHDARFCLNCGTALADAEQTPATEPDLPEKRTYTIVNLDDARLHPLDVVGESHYQDALEEIAGGKEEESAHIETRACLIPEVDNPYDPNAVGVLINDLLVGYVSRDVAPKLHPVLVDLFERRRYILSCPAVIVGGWYRGDGDEGSFGVQLKAPSPKDIAESGGPE